MSKEGGTFLVLLFTSPRTVIFLLVHSCFNVCVQERLFCAQVRICAVQIARGCMLVCLLVYLYMQVQYMREPNCVSALMGGDRVGVCARWVLANICICR